jgi:hypothetical protein
MYTLEKFCIDVPSESKRRDALIFAWKGFKLPDTPVTPTKKPDKDYSFSFSSKGIWFSAGGFLFLSLLLFKASETFGLLLFIAAVSLIFKKQHLIDQHRNSIDELNRKKNSEYEMELQNYEREVQQNELAVDRMRTLQSFGLKFVSDNYDILLNLAQNVIEDTVPKLIGESEFSWKKILRVPIESSVPKLENGYAGPIFEKPMKVSFFGYFGTKKYFAVIPKEAANISSSQSVSQQVVDKIKSLIESNLIADLYEASISVAEQSQFVFSDSHFYGLDQLSAAELYYSEMVMSEYKKINEDIGRLLITTRDNRKFELQSVPEVAENVRTSLRDTK